MKDFEQKRRARIERMRDRAENLRDKSDARYSASRSEIDGIPMGQPILVGHHSERRHRRALEKSHKAMRDSFELSQEADRLERRADAAERSTVIFSDDPAAVQKLVNKLATLETAHAHMVAANKIVRAKKLSTEEKCARLNELGEERPRSLLAPDFAGRPGYPSYALANSRNQIRSVKERIETLREAAKAEPVTREYEGFTLEECPDDNRVRFVFDRKPSKDARAALKRHGFRWAPSVGAWQRHLNAAGRSAASTVLNELQPKPGTQCHS